MPTGFLLGITENPSEFRIDLQNAVTCVEPNNGFWRPAGQHDPHQRVWLLLFVTESAIRCPNRRHLARLFQSLEKTRDAMSSSNSNWALRCLLSSLVPSDDNEIARDRTARVFPWSGQRSETGRAPCNGGSHLKVQDTLRRFVKNMAGATGLEPAASCVTGRRSN